MSINYTDLIDKYCKVEKCNFSKFHVTSGHKCGNCKMYGHGIIECNNPNKKTKLTCSLGDILPSTLQCKFGNCKYKQYHTSDGHHCLMCHERLHDISTCPLNPNITKKIKIILDIKCPLCKQNNKININQQQIYGLTDKCLVCLENNVEIFFPNCGHVCVCVSCFKKITTPIVSDSINVFDDIRDEKILLQQNYQLDKINSILPNYPSYIIIDEGMGCCSFIRRLNSTTLIEGLFNHSDDVYSDLKLKKLDDFIDGYCLISNHDYLEHNWTGY
jgi:hypothetical protein